MKRIKSNMSGDFEVKSALRKRGYITGPEGEDVIPAKLTAGEAVLPPETVEAIGGREAVNELILRTTGKRPQPKMVNGELHAIGGVDDAMDWVKKQASNAGELLRRGARAVGAAASEQTAENVGRAAGETAAKLRTAWKQGVGAFNEGMANGPRPQPQPQGPPTPPQYDPRADKAFQGARRSTAALVREAGGVSQTGQTLGTPSPDPTPKPGLRARIGGAARVGGTLLAAGLEAPQAYQDMTTPGMTAADNVARGAESASRLATSWLGMKGGAALGAAGGPLSWATVPAGAVIGGGLGYFAPDLVSKGYKMLSGDQNPLLPSERAADLRARAAPPKQDDSNTPSGSDPSNDRKEDDLNAPRPADRQDVRPSAFAAVGPPMTQAERDEQARRNHENRMMAYARESALRKQMVEDSLDREYNPGTGLADVMPDPAAERKADMARSAALSALSRISQGTSKRDALKQLMLADAYMKLADSILGGDQKKIDVRKEMVAGHLARQAGLRGKRMDVAAERQKSTDLREAGKYRDDTRLEGDKVAADATVESARLRAFGDMFQATAAQRSALAKVKSDKEAAGLKNLNESLVRRYGDPTKDERARAKINDYMNLLTGTMAKHGYSVDLFTDPRITERLIIETERAAATRNSEKGIVAALRYLFRPNERPMMESDVGSDYYLQALGPQRMFSRAARTEAGDTSQDRFEYGPDAGLLDILTRQRLRRREFFNKIKDMPTYKLDE